MIRCSARPAITSSSRSRLVGLPSTHAATAAAESAAPGASRGRLRRPPMVSLEAKRGTPHVLFGMFVVACLVLAAMLHGKPFMFVMIGAAAVFAEPCRYSPGIRGRRVFRLGELPP